MRITIYDIENIVEKCVNIAQILQILKCPENKYYYTQIRKLLIDNNIDTSHFCDVKIKHFPIERTCPKCGNIFDTYSGGIKSHKYCSRTCANSRTWTEDDKIKRSIALKTSEKAKAVQATRHEAFLAVPKKAQETFICLGCGEVGTMHKIKNQRYHSKCWNKIAAKLKYSVNFHKGLDTVGVNIEQRYTIIDKVAPQKQIKGRIYFLYIV